jgi:hypothetical protein
MNTKRYGFAIIIAMLAALLTTSLAQTSMEGQSVSKPAKKRNDLTGTWLVNVDCDCSTSTANANLEIVRKFPQMLSRESAQAPSQAPFNTVMTFHADGTFAEDSLIDYIAPQSPAGRGGWVRTGENEFAVAHYAVLIGSISDPQFQGTYRTRQKLTTDATGDHFSGIGHVEIFDPAGNLVFTFDGTIQGRRIEVEPLP